jgi:hypothetical protein
MNAEVMKVLLAVLTEDNRELVEHSLLDIDRDYQVLIDDVIEWLLRNLTVVYMF